MAAFLNMARSKGLAGRKAKAFNLDSGKCPNKKPSHVLGGGFGGGVILGFVNRAFETYFKSIAVNQSS